jgi:hypothetical protein
MSTTSQERETAIAAADQTCPRCGAPRQPDQEYCVECGLRLPSVKGTVPSLRRRWVRRLGWYPGDWIWVSLLTLLVAAAGAAASILLTEKTNANSGSTFAATSLTVPVAEPSTAPPTTVNTATLPTAPEPTVTKPSGPPPPPNGRTPWPAGRLSGWTIVLISYPTTGGRTAALSTATRAAQAGLPQVGVLQSANFSSLHPGYFVVFSGIYGTKSQADAALATARAGGFAGAYSRQISR